jgi:hypothetical protein
LAFKGVKVVLCLSKMSAASVEGFSPTIILGAVGRCGKLFCIDCMVPEVSTGDASRLLCLNCARRIVSPKSKAKYEPLKGYLKFRAAFTDSVKLSFAQIDGIIGDNLPMEAYPI